MERTTAQKQAMIGKIINKRFLIRKYIGGGSFGDVYEAEDQETCQIVALKFETDNPEPQLPNEYKCYKKLEGCPHVPHAYDLFPYGKSQVLAMDKMGPSLESLFKRCGKKFSLKTTLVLGDQMIRAIEYVHNSGLLHRDIKPHNFLIGTRDSFRRVFLIDFGVSMEYIDPRTRDQIMFTNNNGLVGTAIYVSVNVHLGEQQSPRDDVESIIYTLIRFLKGSLPWQVIKEKSPDARNEKITQLKMQTSSEVLCEGCPKEFKTLYEYVRKLTFNERPKYTMIRNTFKKLFLQNGFVDDGIYDWDDAAPIHKPLPALYLHKSALRYIKANDRKIKARKEKVFLPAPRNIFLSGWRTH